MLNRAELEAFLIGYTYFYDVTHRTHKRAVRSQVACIQIDRGTVYVANSKLRDPPQLIVLSNCMVTNFH